jgi:hypothetical protein
MRPPDRVRNLGLAAALAVGLAPGCSDPAPTVVPAPPPTPTPVVTPAPGSVIVGSRTGPTEITFLSAEPVPGATVDGCGRDASGCAGRVRMRFRLLSRSGGPVLDAIGFLHAMTKIACHRGSTGRLDLRPAVAQEVVIVFDQADPACGVPATISDMKVVLSGPVETASLQEWAVRYELRP